MSKKFKIFFIFLFVFTFLSLYNSVKANTINKISMDIFVDDDNIITVSRKITESRSVSKINGETVNVKTLKTIISILSLS